MAKSRFYYGVVGARKSAEALLLAHKMIEAGKSIVLLQPAINTRDGAYIRSRAIKDDMRAILVDDTVDIRDLVVSADVVIVDEVQFLGEKNRGELIEVIKADNKKLVFCYGLMSDFNGRLFPAIAHLIPFFQKLIEIDTVCTECGERKATMNKMIGEHEAVDGISVGNHYKGVCVKCWAN